MKRLLILLLPVLLLAACGSPETPAPNLEATAQTLAQTAMAATLTAQPSPTATAVPPTATAQPTATPLPTEPPTEIPSPTATALPSPTTTTSPADVQNSLRTFYVQTDENYEPIDCGDNLMSIKIGIERTGDPATDVYFALNSLFAVHQPYILGLYNAYGAVGTSFQVDEVVHDANANKLDIFISGRYHRNNQPRCENLRVHRQIALTVKDAAPGVRFDLWVNGQTIKDVLLGD